jgi:DNA polymerase III gamma/tau subunit
MPIIGHEKIISFFDKLIVNNSLSQSYCFVGREMVGKRTMARYLAAQLLKIDEAKLDTYPDFYYLSRAVDEKSGKLKKEISIAQARGIKERLGGKSWFGAYQVVIIDEAELLNEESGNALLKILEEPTEKRVFFLLTSDDSKLLPTIRSRCQMVYFSLVSASKIEQALLGLGHEKKIAREAAELAWGRPGRGIELCNNEELKINADNESKRWATIMNVPFYKKLTAVEDLLKDASAAESNKTDTVRTGEKLQDILETWQILWRDVMLDKLQNKENKILAGSSVPMSKILAVMDSFKKSKILLGQNINPKLVVEQILLSLN